MSKIYVPPVSPVYYLFLSFLLFPLLSSCSSQLESSASLTPQAISNGVIPEPVTYTINGQTIVKPDVKEATVIEVMDGDTIKVTIDGKEEIVRLLLIDTPMTAEPWGKEANDATKTNVLGKQVGLEQDTQNRNEEGQLLAYVWQDNQLINASLLDNGYARVAAFPSNTKYTELFQSIQDQSHAKNIGIWSVDNYVTNEGFHPEALIQKEDVNIMEAAPPKEIPTQEEKTQSTQKQTSTANSEPSPPPAPKKPMRTYPADGPTWHVKTE